VRDLELEGRRERFCQAFVYEANGNSALAARIAGYSEKSARKIASSLRTKMDVQKRIRELKLEYIKESGYDRDKVKKLIADRLLAIVDTNYTDVVYMSSGLDDPRRAEVMEAIMRLNGGQRVLDFGDAVVIPTLALSEGAQAAIKSVRFKRDSEGGYLAPEIELHDVIMAAKTLAQILGIGESDSNVNVNFDLAGRLEAGRKRVMGEKDLEALPQTPPGGSPPGPSLLGSGKNEEYADR
jgi:hypothetical protein